MHALCNRYRDIGLDLEMGDPACDFDVHPSPSAEDSSESECELQVTNLQVTIPSECKDLSPNALRCFVLGYELSVEGTDAKNYGSGYV